MAQRSGLPPRHSRFARSLPLGKRQWYAPPRSLDDVDDEFKAKAASSSRDGPRLPPTLRLLQGIGDDPELIELYALGAVAERWSARWGSQFDRSRGHRCVDALRDFISHDDSDAVPARLRVGGAIAPSAETRVRMPKIPMIHPFSKFRIIWNMMMMLVLTSVLVILPVSIAFFYNDDGQTWLPYNIVCDCLFVIDIVLNFRTGVEEGNGVLMDPGEVARRYARSWFIVDLVSILPIDYIMLFVDTEMSFAQGSSVRAVRLIKLLQLIRVLRISRMMRYFSALQKIFHVATAVAGMVRMGAVALLVSHWSACVQFFVPAMMNFPDDSWVVCTKVKDAYWFDQYVNAWFKSLSHELGIGYGQCAALNMPEIWVSVLSMFIASTIWLILAAHTIDIMYGVNTSRNLFDAHMQEVQEYMVAMSFPMSLREKMYSYYDSRYGEKMFNEEKIFSELSDSLKQEIIRHNSKELIQKSPLLSAATSHFVDDVISVLKPQLFQPEDYIYRAHTRAKEMYLLQDGVVEIIDIRGETVTKLAGGSYFGELSLINNKNRTSSAKAVTYCHVYAMAKEDFEFIFAEHPHMKIRLKKIALQRAALTKEDCRDTDIAASVQEKLGEEDARRCRVDTAEVFPDRVRRHDADHRPSTQTPSILEVDRAQYSFGKICE